MTKDEALNLALQLVSNLQTHSWTVADEQLVITTIKEALAQPEQEPVAYWNFNSGFSHCMIDQLNEAAKKNPAPLYTTPPQRKPLSDEEIEIIAKEHINVGTRSFEEFARRIEAAHGIKGEA